MFIDQVQHPNSAPIVRPRADEIVAPYVAHTLRPEAYARPIVEPQPPSWLLLLRYFQPFATPDSLDPIFTYSPAGSLQQRRDPPIPVAAILTVFFLERNIVVSDFRRIFVRRLFDFFFERVTEL